MSSPSTIWSGGDGDPGGGIAPEAQTSVMHSSYMLVLPEYAEHVACASLMLVPEAVHKSSFSGAQRSSTLVVHGSVVSR